MHGEGRRLPSRLAAARLARTLMRRSQLSSTLSFGRRAVRENGTIRMRRRLVESLFSAECDVSTSAAYPAA